MLPLAIRHDKYKGNAEYHPGGQYILFTSENENGNHQPWNQPGAGANHDIFVMNSTGTEYWRLTNSAAGTGLLHPAFSPDGTKLFWAEMYYSALFPPQGQEYGLWNLKMADFAVVLGTPQISNVVSFAPRDSVWYESHSFSPDGGSISFTSHQEDSSAVYGDITVMSTADIGTSNFVILTNTPYIHDEHSHWSPDGNKISWMSGTHVGGLGIYRSELYLMDADGTDPVQLTHFTEAGFPEYIQDTLVTADHYWSPDGTRIFGFVHFIDGLSWQSELYQLEFMGPCGLDPSSGMPARADADVLQLYPNPVDDKLHIVIAAQAGPVAEVVLYDMLGRKAMSTRRNVDRGSIVTDVSALPEGVYAVRVVLNDRGVQETKVVVAR